jgi:hypothetical protein
MPNNQVKTGQKKDTSNGGVATKTFDLRTLVKPLCKLWAPNSLPMLEWFLGAHVCATSSRIIMSMFHSKL